MGAVETYNVRLDFQGRLDELFPSGTWATLLEQLGDQLMPVGVEITTGRVFCSNAVETDEGWFYELFIDPRADDPLVQQWENPLTAWVGEMIFENDLYAEAQVLTAEDEIVVIRLAYDPQGPRAPAPAQREFVTTLREAELFPRGMERLGLGVVQ